MQALVRLSFLSLTVALAAGIVLGQTAAVRPTPEAALQSLQKALESGDWRAVAEVLAHPKEPRPFVPLALVEAWLRAQSASVQLEAALRELAEKTGAPNPQASGAHPFSPYLNPSGELAIQILDVGAAGPAGKVRARIKCVHRGRAEEETVVVVRLGNSWYVTPPTALRQLFADGENPTVASRRTEGMNKLADILTETAQLVRAGHLKDRPAVLEHLLRRFHSTQLADLLR
ncbi:hypothetical protein HRbin36_02052 [bacterium HR36]|nr:hypothetical protein HRbin36_02052 [bacterium HR36]